MMMVFLVDVPLNIAKTAHSSTETKEENRLTQFPWLLRGKVIVITVRHTTL